jgi:hypothetical protein
MRLAKTNLAAVISECISFSLWFKLKKAISVVRTEIASLNNVYRLE